jgi:hypothetical protein
LQDAVGSEKVGLSLELTDAWNSLTPDIQQAIEEASRIAPTNYLQSIL